MTNTEKAWKSRWLKRHKEIREILEQVKEHCNRHDMPLRMEQGDVLRLLELMGRN